MLKIDAKVLIVDDMMTMRKMVTKIMKTAGYTNLTEANSGTAAWELVSQAVPPFDLILSDWNMPNGTGIDLLKRLRADTRLSKTPMIMITAEAEKTQIVEALQNKVTDYVIKPFSLETIMDKLKNLS
jgi:two-component system, chemotaxis family, chemotaxis protein CheY